MLAKLPKNEVELLPLLETNNEVIKAYALLRQNQLNLHKHKNGSANIIAAQRIFESYGDTEGLLHIPYFKIMFKLHNHNLTLNDIEDCFTSNINKNTDNVFFKAAKLLIKVEQAKSYIKKLTLLQQFISDELSDEQFFLKADLYGILIPISEALSFYNLPALYLSELGKTLKPYIRLSLLKSALVKTSTIAVNNGETKKAEVYILDNIKYYQSESYHSAYKIALTNLCRIKIADSKFNEASTFLKKLVDVSDEKNVKEKITCLELKVSLYSFTEPQTAINLYNELGISTELRSFNNQHLAILGNLAEASMRLSQYQQAMNYLEFALQHEFIEHMIVQKSKLLLLLKNCHQKLGNYNAAANALNQAYRLMLLYKEIITDERMLVMINKLEFDNENFANLWSDSLIYTVNEKANSAILVYITTIKNFLIAVEVIKLESKPILRLENIVKAYAVNIKLFESVKALILNNISLQTISGSFITNELAINRVQLNNNIKQNAGLTINNLIVILRLNFSRKLLKNNSLNVSEVAFQSGFSSLSYFSRLFKRHFGISPKKFQDKNAK